MIEITVEELLAIHKATIDEHGGLPGLKSEGMMLSALAQPMMGMGDIDFYPTLPEKIAALGFSLATNHAFHDGNKRVAFISMSVFALKNAYLLEVPEEEAIEFMLALADGGNKSVGRDELVQWLAD
ncbi:MAG: type II toxin-antitoxin system death-on-curing family toxin, partial [Proteobacteria bacterium]